MRGQNTAAAPSDEAPKQDAVPHVGAQERPAPKPKGAHGYGNKWAKGMPSPNPGGRPKGLAAMVRDIVDFEQVVRKVFEIATGVAVSDTARLQAAKLLFDRGYGQAPQTLRIQENEGPRVGEELAVHLSDEELDALERAHTRTLERLEVEGPLPQ